MKVSELLTDENKWCQQAFAMDKYGDAVSSRDVDACKWCLSGALMKCYSIEAPVDQTEYMLHHRKLMEVVGDLIDWNDAPERTFAEVREAILKAGV